MRRGTRILLIVLGSIFLLGCVVVGAAIWFVTYNTETWKTQAYEWVQDSEEAGRALDTRGCVDRAIAQYRKDPGMLSLQTQQLWLNGCLSKAKPEPSLCVELRTDWTQDPDFIRKADSPWSQLQKLGAVRRQYCVKQGLAHDRNCVRFIKKIEAYCADADFGAEEPDAPTEQR